ncbi:cytochrome c oxidase assembly protein [Nocardioides sp. PD653]|uniref:cytochrome c oxidase assembly protein n=1 Tax=Nocardioides sp. PD653 TaxID=393303 RepID=UPI0009EFC242|nr:cytochrome c oxidase assembly protein [Nocardioides sp. PD653]GAW56478.1 putative copper resistance protein D [Nocardioides sp. PD653]
MLAACCIPPREPEGRNRVEGARRVALDLAVVSAGIWLWSGLALLGFTFSEASGDSLATEDSLSAIVYFAENFELGRYLTISSAIAAFVSVGCLIARRTVSMGLLAVVALLGLWPMALTGHAAGTLEHDNAVNLQAMHLLGVSVWAGGLIALLVTRRRLGDSLVPTVRRYSTLAGCSLVLVAVSGALGALLRVPELSDLGSSYGALLALKVGAFAVLCGLAWWQRRRLIGRLAAGHRRAFLWIGLLEVVVLTAATGTGVALSRTAPPPPPGAGTPLSAAQSLLGHDLPPALGAAEWFTQWRPDIFWLPIVLGGLAWYLVAVSKLRARGDTWPVSRTIAWVVGSVLLVWATSGSPGAYGRVLFSMHMVAHMTIATAVPVFLALGAPVTLALRTLNRRTDGSMGPREWLQRVIHSWPAAILGNPIVAGTLFIVSLAAFYYSSLFELSLRTHTAHILMVGHFRAGRVPAGQLPGRHRPGSPATSVPPPELCC